MSQDNKAFLQAIENLLEARRFAMHEMGHADLRLTDAIRAATENAPQDSNFMEDKDVQQALVEFAHAHEELMAILGGDAGVGTLVSVLAAQTLCVAMGTDTVPTREEFDAWLQEQDEEEYDAWLQKQEQEGEEEFPEVLDAMIPERRKKGRTH